MTHRPRHLLNALRASLAGLALLFSLATAGAQTPVRVASKIDTEGSLLGNLIIQTLEANGIRTQNRLQLGTTQVVRGALVAGEIDVYPEYTGNGAFFFADEKNPVWKDLKAGHARVKALDQEKHQLVWLQPAPANNTWAIALRQEVASANKLATMEDFGRWVAGGGKVKLAASAEFIERPDALPAFQAGYGFKLAQDQLLALAGGDTAVTLKTAAEGTSGVNAAMAYGTDGPVAALGLVLLTDTRHVQPVYAPAPVVRAALLKQWPRLPAVLDPVFASLDAPTLQRLNAQIALEGQDAKTVAGRYLKAKGFIK